MRADLILKRVANLAVLIRVYLHFLLVYLQWF